MENIRPHHYSRFIQWDEEDAIFVVSIPELQLKTHGKTYDEALKNASEVVELWLTVAIEDGKPLPPPQTYGM